MIRNFVFDIGNVLVDWHTVPYIMKTLGCDGETAAEYDRMVFESVEWKDGDRGTRTRAQTREALLAGHPEHGREINALLDHADDILIEYDFNTDVVRSLRAAGYGVYYLSNTNPQAFEKMTSTCGFFGLMDGGIASFRDGLLKPSGAIFELFAERFDKDPAECCFVDDTEVNTAAAAAEGFGTITLRRPEDLRSEIEKLLGTEI